MARKAQVTDHNPRPQRPALVSSKVGRAPVVCFRGSKPTHAGIGSTIRLCKGGALRIYGLDFTSFLKCIAPLALVEQTLSSRGFQNNFECMHAFMKI